MHVALVPLLQVRKTLSMCAAWSKDQTKVKKITAHNWKNYDPDNKSWLTSCRCVTAALKHLARIVNKPLSLQA